MPLGPIWMPAPSSGNSGRRSQTRTSTPLWASAIAVAKPSDAASGNYGVRADAGQSQAYVRGDTAAGIHGVKQRQLRGCPLDRFRWL